MGMSLVDHLKQRHAFESWRGVNTLDENLLVWRFFLTGEEFPGWQAHRIHTGRDAGMPAVIQSIWVGGVDLPGATLSVDIFECTSRVAAHDFLIALLAQFQSADMRRREKAAWGDVAFAGPGDAAALFARANLVVLLRNADREPIPIPEIAARFDREVTSKPNLRARVVPEIRRFQVAPQEVKPPAGVPLELEAADPLDRPLWFKFFSRSGEVRLEEGRLVYRPISAGPQEVTVYAINANRGAAVQQLRFVSK